MNRSVLFVAVVATMLVLGGCVDAGGYSETESTPETDDELLEADDVDDESADSGSTADTDSDGEPAADDGDIESPTDHGDSTLADDESADQPAVDGDLEIHHIDVGQADATLVVDPSGETMLIDSGDWRQGGEDVIAYLEGQNVDRIDHLVATHGHADHIGGHDAIIEHYETERDGIGAAYDSGVPHTSQTYDRYLDAVEEHDVDLLLVEDGDRFEVGETSVDVRNPPAEGSDDDLHYNSVALHLEFGDFLYLTTGDAEADAEQRMGDEHGDALAADVYQAGHHGSTTSSTDPFVDRVSPDVAVISSAYDSQYGHPHDEVLEDFADRGIETYWTGVHGDVVVTTDGQSAAIETEHAFSTDAAALLAEKPADDDGQQSIRPSIDVPGALTVGA